MAPARQQHAGRHGDRALRGGGLCLRRCTCHLLVPLGLAHLSGSTGTSSHGFPSRFGACVHAGCSRRGGHCTVVRPGCSSSVGLPAPRIAQHPCTLTRGGCGLTHRWSGNSDSANPSSILPWPCHLPMKILFPAVLLLAPLLAGPGAFAGDTTCTTNREGRTVCPAPDSSCLKDRYGDVICSTPGGGIEIDRYGDPVCGPGYCTKDLRGDLFCSNAPRGASSTDRVGNAVCAGQCVPAKREACVKPQPAK